MMKRIENEDWSGTRFKNINLAGTKFVEANLANADLNGFIGGLKVNGIEVGPLIAAELDRCHPERKRLYPVDLDGCREALSVVAAQLEATWKRARDVPEEGLHEQVDEEWSTVETVRHLVFVVDSWVGRILHGQPDPYHPIGLPPSFLPRKPPGTSIDPDAHPTFDEALDVWRGRFATLTAFVDGLTAHELERKIDHDHAKTVLGALWIVFGELWAHNMFMNRDLDTLEAT